MLVAVGAKVLVAVGASLALSALMAFPMLFALRVASFAKIRLSTACSIDFMRSLVNCKKGKCRMEVIVCL